MADAADGGAAEWTLGIAGDKRAHRQEGDDIVGVDGGVDAKEDELAAVDASQAEADVLIRDGGGTGDVDLFDDRAGVGIEEEQAGGFGVEAEDLGRLEGGVSGASLDRVEEEGGSWDQGLAAAGLDGDELDLAVGADTGDEAAGAASSTATNGTWDGQAAGAGDLAVGQEGGGGEGDLVDRAESFPWAGAVSGR